MHGGPFVEGAGILVAGGGGWGIGFYFIFGWESQQIYNIISPWMIDIRSRIPRDNLKGEG